MDLIREEDWQKDYRALLTEEIKQFKEEIISGNMDIEVIKALKRIEIANLQYLETSLLS